MVIEPVLTIFRSVADGAGLLVVDRLLQAIEASSADRVAMKRIGLIEIFISTSFSFRDLVSTVSYVGLPISCQEFR